MSREDYEFAKSILTEAGESEANLNGKKPCYWSVLLEQQRARSNGCFYGVDAMLMERAVGDGKALVSLETPEHHGAYFSSQSDALQEWLFHQAANEAAFSDFSDEKRKLDRWADGSLRYEDEVEPVRELTEEELAALSDEERTDYERNKEYVAWLEETNTARNREMTDTILRSMGEGKKLLVVAGAMHFLCVNNVLECLEQQGCSVTAYPEYQE